MTLTTPLTPRQRQLCDLLCAGNNVREAAAVMGVTDQSARSHVRDARRAYAVASLTELVELHSGGTATYQHVHGGGRKRADGLTAGQYALFELAATGLSWTEVCTLNKISYNTIRTQTQRAYRKLGVRNRTAALIELGLLRRGPGVMALSEPFDDHELDPRTLPYSGYEAVAATEE